MGTVQFSCHYSSFSAAWKQCTSLSSLKVLYNTKTSQVQSQIEKRFEPLNDMVSSISTNCALMCRIQQFYCFSLIASIFMTSNKKKKLLKKVDEDGYWPYWSEQKCLGKEWTQPWSREWGHHLRWQTQHPLSRSWHRDSQRETARGTDLWTPSQATQQLLFSRDSEAGSLTHSLSPTETLPVSLQLLRNPNGPDEKSR